MQHCCGLILRTTARSKFALFFVALNDEENISVLNMEPEHSMRCCFQLEQKLKERKQQRAQQLPDAPTKSSPAKSVTTTGGVLTADQRRQKFAELDRINQRLASIKQPEKPDKSDERDRSRERVRERERSRETRERERQRERGRETGKDSERARSRETRERDRRREHGKETGPETERARSRETRERDRDRDSSWGSRERNRERDLSWETRERRRETRERDAGPGRDRRDRHPSDRGEAQCGDSCRCSLACKLMVETVVFSRSLPECPLVL